MYLHARAVALIRDGALLSAVRESIPDAGFRSSSELKAIAMADRPSANSEPSRILVKLRASASRAGPATNKINKASVWCRLRSVVCQPGARRRGDERVPVATNA